MEKLEKGQWYEAVADYIDDNLEDFYMKFYKDHDLVKAGKDFRLEPCPMCHHRNCCTVGVAVHCFSCKWTGGHINAWTDYASNVLGITTWEALKALEKFTNIPFPNTSSEDIAEYKKNQKRQQIYRTAESFYHKQLLESRQTFSFQGKDMTALEYITRERCRQLDTIVSLKIGLSENYPLLRESLLHAGFTEEEIKEAKVWVPEGLFVFFYRNPNTKDIVRINTKNPFKVRYRKFDSNGGESLGEVIQGHSVGNKAFLFSPKFNFKKPFAVVEGEHDLASLLENGCENVCCIGGNLPERLFEFSLAKAQDKIYLMFDNDHKGKEYAETANNELPHKNLFEIRYSSDYKDPDEYYVKNVECQNFEALTKSSVQLETEQFKIIHQGMVWSAVNRHKRMDYVITGRKGKEDGPYKIIGKAILYVNGEMKEREDETPLHSLKRKFHPMKHLIADAMDDYFNRDIESKNNETLLVNYDFSSKKAEIIKTLANRIYELKNNEESDKAISKMKDFLLKVNNINADNLIDAILKEFNGICNQNITKTGYPRMMICQHYSVKNNDAYMYYTVIKKDGDSVRRLPYLLRNDKTSIRLDLLKRKDDQCLILIDNKYELPEEVKTAQFSYKACSLTQEAVEKYVNGEIPQSELCPNKLAKRVEKHIRKFYYSRNEDVYKVLTLYCMATYYYTLFPELPYFHINGQKGSGKTALDATLEMLCFNACRLVSFTEAALFRKIAFEGGTLILDETENMTTRRGVQDSSIAAILKGGYSKNNRVSRFNVDKQCTEEFEIYGPKVLSNIFGLEDVLSDRCIPINSERCNTASIDLISPESYTENHMDEVKELTGKLCFCALENFQKVFVLFEDKKTMFKTDTPRLTQIMNPLLAIARLVDIPEKERLIKEHADMDLSNLVGEFEASLYNYYELHVKEIKTEIENSTPEGTISDIVKCIAMELCGLTPVTETHYTNPENHKYKGKIEYNKDEGWFELNTIHFKVFMEESHPGDLVYTRQIPGYLKRVFNINSPYKRKIATLENEELIRELKCMKTKVYAYRFDVGKILKPPQLDRPTSEEILSNIPETSLF
jgi:DNA primase